MKKRKTLFIIVGFILFMFIINFFFPKQIILECSLTSQKDFDTVDQEEIDIDLYFKKIFLFFRKQTDSYVRTIDVSFNRELTNQEAFHYGNSLESLYCNKKLKDSYSCDSSWDNKHTIVVNEKGSFKKIINDKNKMNLKQYKKKLKKDGYTCRRKNS